VLFVEKSNGEVVVAKAGLAALAQVQAAFSDAATDFGVGGKVGHHTELLSVTRAASLNALKPDDPSQPTHPTRRPIARPDRRSAFSQVYPTRPR
jgi:hypothetical protein